MPHDMELGNPFAHYEGIEGFRMPESANDGKKDGTSEFEKPEKKKGSGRKRKTPPGNDANHKFLLSLESELFQKVKTLSVLQGWSITGKINEMLEEFVQAEMKKDGKVRRLFEE